jgi:hypothetical protein
MTPRSRLARLAALFRRRKLDREVDDEILAHLELRVVVSEELNR